MGRPAIDLNGMVFNDWTVIGRELTFLKNAKWICRCKCGNIRSVEGQKLRKGTSKSCGCERSELIRKMHTTHGMCRTRMYTIWHGMLDRCNNSNTKHYNLYGGRGISVCKEWETFINFYNDMKPTYDDSLSIDRIDGNGNYELNNCRWANLDVQNNNRRSNIFITINGETKTIKHWADSSGVKYETIRSRMKIGIIGMDLLKRV